MRWVRLLASVAVMLIGLFIALVGVGAGISAVFHLYDQSILLIPFVVIYLGTVLGGAAVLYFGVRLFKRNLRRQAAT